MNLNSQGDMGSRQQYLDATLTYRCRCSILPMTLFI